jgi:hypothetical protein
MNIFEWGMYLIHYFVAIFGVAVGANNFDRNLERHPLRASGMIWVRRLTLQSPVFLRQLPFQISAEPPHAEW